MKKLLLIILLLLATGCRVQQIPVETIYTYKDSTIVNYVDSTVIIPVERIKDIVPDYDTLRMETSKALSKSWVDTTTHTLKGTLENKSGVEYKYIYREKEVVKDTVITKEVPVEVEKIVKTHYPYEKYLWAWLILSVLGIGAGIYLKLKK